MPDLQPMVIALSAIMPIEGFSVVQMALLQRRMQFKSLAIRDNVATAVGGVTGVTMAFCGFGGWALVFQHIARELTSVVTLWKISDWRPGFEFRFSSIRELANYSTKTLLGRLGSFAQNSTDSILIGVLLGPVALGLYRLANRLVEMNLMFLPRAIQIVSLPHFSKFQSDLPELNRNFLFASHLNSIVTFPSLAFLAGASSVILKAIGPQWSDAVTVLQILSLIGISKTIILLIGPLLQAVSRAGTHSFNVWTLAISNGLAVLAAAFLFSHKTDEQQIVAVAAFRTAVFLGIFTPLLLWQAKRATALSVYGLLGALSPAIMTSSIVYVGQFLYTSLGI
jgi:PST family polysaccharide transporter